MGNSQFQSHIISSLIRNNWEINMHGQQFRTENHKRNIWPQLLHGWSHRISVLLALYANILSLRMSTYHFSVKWIAIAIVLRMSFGKARFDFAVSHLLAPFKSIHLYSYLDSVLTSFLHTMSHKFQFLNSSQLDFKMEFRIQCSSALQKFNYTI